MNFTHAGNYNWGMSKKMADKISKDLRKEHKCNVCGKVRRCEYVKPYLCQECAVKIYEGRN